MSAEAQTSGNNQPRQDDTAYHRGRIYISEPPFNLAKVKRIISDIKPVAGNMENNLPANIYNSLSLREKFTYNAIHLEFYNGKYEMDPVFSGEDKKIFAQLPVLYGGSDWSIQQTNFFDDNTDSVLKLIKEDVLRTNKFGLNYKHMIVERRAKAIIPFLVDFYKKDRKDQDILTVLLLMMQKWPSYSDFEISPEYGRLYGSSSEFHGEFIEANKANEDQVMLWALDYYKGVSPESQNYGEYRGYLSEPPYGIAKVKKLAEKLTKDNAVFDEEGDRRPSLKLFQSYTLREKFTYHMIYFESYSQNCDGPPTIYNEDKKIFAHLPDMSGEDDWSDRQEKFMKTYKDSVAKYIQEDAARTNRMGLNYKHAIVIANATGIIPFLVEFYKKERKDHDVLTVLMLLMENNKYPEFMSSISHKKLYMEGAPGDFYNKSLVLNTANEDLIMQRAMNFYNGLKKK